MSKACPLTKGIFRLLLLRMYGARSDLAKVLRTPVLSRLKYCMVFYEVLPIKMLWKPTLAHD